MSNNLYPYPPVACAPTSREGSPSRHGGANFIWKLRHILSDDNFEGCIRWSDDGRRIIIPNSDEFKELALKRLCKSQNFNSFIRQLNNYGFKKTNNASRNKGSPNHQTWEFEHEAFQRDMVGHETKIRRIIGKSNESSRRTTPNLSNDPVPAIGPSTATTTLISPSTQSESASTTNSQDLHNAGPQDGRLSFLERRLEHLETMHEDLYMAHRGLENGAIQTAQLLAGLSDYLVAVRTPYQQCCHPTTRCCSAGAPSRCQNHTSQAQAGTVKSEPP